MAISGTTALIIAAAAAVAAAGVTAYAAVKQGEAADENAKFNAKMAGREAESRRNAAAAAAEDARRRHEILFGEQRNKYGASGVLIEEGSPLLVMMNSEEEAALDVARIKHGGREAATTLTLEGQAERWRGRQARSAGYLGAGAALLQGVSSAAGAYGRMGGGTASTTRAGGGAP